MLFPWKKNPPSKSGRTAESWKRELSDRLRLPAQENKCVIRFTNVDLAPSFQGLNCSIHQGSWLLLAGPDDFGKALFCDLCFNFIHPERGEVNPLIQGSQVSFLGRSNTTYGSALIDHLYSGVREHSKELAIHVIEKVFGSNLKKQLSPNNFFTFSNNRTFSQVELSERDFLEIAEANLILQNRPAAIIDTTSDFYRIAIEQGFQHSTLLLESGKTLFWIIDDAATFPDEKTPWKVNPGIKKSSLYFVNEGLVGHIN